jgi:hypothetical protein
MPRIAVVTVISQEDPVIWKTAKNVSTVVVQPGFIVETFPRKSG